MLSGDDLERLANQFEGRTIHSDIYCSQCGYNLRTRGYIGRCPECGGDYNARSLDMKGVFTARLLTFPTGDLLATLVSGSCAVYLLYSGIRPVQPDSLMFALLFAIPAAIFGYFTWQRGRRYFHYSRIARQIERQEQY